MEMVRIIHTVEEEKNQTADRLQGYRQ